jgi:hypothetical protein
MAFDIQLEDEQGAPLVKLPDTHNVLPRLLDRANDSSDCCLPFVDPYGNTVFNRLQMKSLIQELDRVSQGASANEIAFAYRLRELAVRCLEEVHLYLRFYGD